jgi:peptidoglycan/xylan/chitin deacetylase (PgdA/CDA1 family)
MMLHGSPIQHAAAFRHQLEWARSHFDIVDFATIKQTWQRCGRDLGGPSREERHKQVKPLILLTFDDGLANNYTVAAPLLEEMGIRGLFFVVPEFAQRRGEKARDYCRERIWPGHAADKAGFPTPDDFLPMTPEQIGDLAARGHTIGNHTLSHARLSNLSLPEVESQIVESSQRIESWIGHPVETFAWTFDTDGITREGWRLACQHHAYCFSPCSGMMDLQRNSPRLIYRTCIGANSPKREHEFMYSGLADWLWARRRKKLAAWLSEEHGRRS